MMTSGKLNSYLSEIDEQAEKMFLQLVKELADKECITEKLKAGAQRRGEIPPLCFLYYFSFFEYFSIASALLSNLLKTTLFLHSRIQSKGIPTAV